MMKRNNKRRPATKDWTTPNPTRAIYISGDFDDSLIARVTPQILELRHASNAPITVFIDSCGGNVSAGAVIAGLLRTPNRDGQTCWINTVATGFAASAAADLLVSGDYITAYQHSTLHFHGTRTSEETVTAEVARELERSLVSGNRTAALRLADAMFDRFLSNYSELQDEVRDLRANHSDELQDFDSLLADGTIDVPSFVIALSHRVQEPYERLLLYCLERTKVTNSIVRAYRQTVADPRNLPKPITKAIRAQLDHAQASDVVKPIHLLNLLFASRIADDAGWSLNGEDFAELEQEYRELQAVADGFFQDDLLQQLSQYQHLFIPKSDMSFFQRHKEADLDDSAVAKQMDEIVGRAYAKIEPLWSFTVALCRYLNSGENQIAPEDAWWLGIIDEVVGTPLARRNITPRIEAQMRSQLPISQFSRFDR